MIIDYPSIKKDLSKVLLRIFNNSVQGELGPFQGIQHLMQHEGKKGSYSTVDGKVKDKDYQLMEVNYKIQYADIPNMTFEDVVKLVEQKGKEMGEQMGKYFFKTVNDVIDETGNVVQAHGKPFSLDLMFETLEKMPLAFDEEGNPRMPTLVIHPDMTPRVRELIAQEEKEKKYEARHKALVEQKRKEWNEEQNRRKLVD